VTHLPASKAGLARRKGIKHESKHCMDCGRSIGLRTCFFPRGVAEFSSLDYRPRILGFDERDARKQGTLDKVQGKALRIPSSCGGLLLVS